MGTMADAQKFRSLTAMQKEIREVHKAGDIVSHILIGQKLFDEIAKEFVPHIPPGKRIKKLVIEKCAVIVGVNLGDWEYSIAKIEMKKLRN